MPVCFIAQIRRIRNVIKIIMQTIIRKFMFILFICVHFVRKLILTKFSFFFSYAMQAAHSHRFTISQAQMVLSALNHSIFQQFMDTTIILHRETKVNEKAYESILNNNMANNALWCRETFKFFGRILNTKYVYANCALVLWANVFFFDPFLLSKLKQI